MAETRRCRRFATEASDELRIPGVLRLEDFESDRDIEIWIVGAVDPGKAAGAEEGRDAIFAEGAAEIAFRQSASLYRKGPVQ